MKERKEKSIDLFSTLFTLPFTSREGRRGGGGGGGGEEKRDSGNRDDIHNGSDRIDMDIDVSFDYDDDDVFRWRKEGRRDELSLQINRNFCCWY